MINIIFVYSLFGSPSKGIQLFSCQQENLLRLQENSLKIKSL